MENEEVEALVSKRVRELRPPVDHVYEVYIRTSNGETKHLPLREGLEEFLDPLKGYRISINIEGVVITLRNSWDRDQSLEQSSLEVLATIRGL